MDILDNPATKEGSVEPKLKECVNLLSELSARYESLIMRIAGKVDKIYSIPTIIHSDKEEVSDVAGSDVISEIRHHVSSLEAGANLMEKILKHLHHII